ncbi:unannotated protein [freshwater metagenome]|uniref:Unannotated protein n=1 Tax=freshwater metagenome TaxID=449393 RepID=A0A6J7JEP1_9ZZZZ|nr:FtsX-like permease family protein [Actinomycetota bacterium]
MLRLILVDLRRHAARTLLTALGISIGVATIVALLALSSGVERSAAGLIKLGGAELGMFQGGVGELTASSLPRSITPRVREVPGVSDATPITVATGELPDRPSFLVFGVDPDGFVVDSLVFTAGRAARSPREAVLGDAAARELGLGPGDTLRLKGGGDFRVSGIYHAGVAFEDQGAGLSLDVVSKMRGRPEDATTIAVKIERGQSASEVGKRLERAFPGTIAISQPGQVSRVDTNSLLLRKATTLFVAIALIIGGIAVMNTMLMAVFGRRSEFALLLAIGWPRRMVAQLVVWEGLLLSLVGAVIGVALGVAGGELLVRAFDASALVSPSFSVWTFARAFLIAGAMGMVGSLYPAWWVTRLMPARALG